MYVAYTESIQSMYVNTVARGQTQVTNVDTYRFRGLKNIHMTVDTNGRKTKQLSQSVLNIQRFLKLYKGTVL